jgi:hypothetical protein
MTDSQSATVRDNQIKDCQRGTGSDSEGCAEWRPPVAMKMPSGNRWRNQVLEPDAGKLARPVLRGGCGSDAASLPDLPTPSRPEPPGAGE